jgi:hypothetical protein
LVRLTAWQRLKASQSLRLQLPSSEVSLHPSAMVHIAIFSSRMTGYWRGIVLFPVAWRGLHACSDDPYVATATCLN